MKKFSRFFTLIGVVLCFFLLLSLLKIESDKLLPETGSTVESFSRRIWTVVTKENITATPVENAGWVFVRTKNSILALDATTGSKIWQAASPSDTPLNLPPLVSGNYLIVPEKNSRIVAFSTDTGKFLWRTPAYNQTKGDSPRLISVIVVDDKVIAARLNWSLAAYEITNGNLAWENKQSGRSSLNLASDGKIIYLGEKSFLQAYDASNGNLLWQKDLNSYIGNVMVVGKTLYAVDLAKSGLIAIDLSTQNVIWMDYFEGVNEYDIRCVRVDDDKLLLSSERIIAISRMDGLVLWKSENLGHLECPVVLGNRLYVRNISTTLFAFDLSTGEDKGKLTVQSNAPTKFYPNRSPVAAQGLLIVPVNDHQIIAYQP